MPNTQPPRRIQNPRALLALPLVLAFLAGSASAAEPGTGDWIQFLGPSRSGVASAVELTSQFPAEGPTVRWRIPVGEGFSGIVRQGDHIYTQLAEGDEEFLAAFRFADGEEVWRLPLGGKFVENFGNGPRATPTLDGDLVFGLGSKGRLVAAQRSDGTVLWQRELAQEFRITVPQKLPAVSVTPGEEHLPVFGYSASPLVVGGLVIVQAGATAGKSILALDRSTGEERWTALDDEVGYSSPTLVELVGQRQILVLTGDHLASLTLDGSTLFHQPWPITTSQPVLLGGDRIFLSTVNDVGAQVFEVHAGDAGLELRPGWKERKMRNSWASSVLHHGAIYGFDNGTLRCLDAATGELHWAHRGLGQGTLILADDKLVVLGDRGSLHLVEATSEAYRELASGPILEGRSWTSPTLAGTTLLVRNHEEMVAVDLAP